MTDVTPSDESTAPLTFTAYAERIGKSRPYVSKLVITGVIHGPALTPDRRIIPAVADQQRAEAADPARRLPGRTATAADGSYAAERALKIAADRRISEHELAVRQGLYIERALIGPALTAFTRDIRDGVLEAIREAEDTPAAEIAVEQFLARKSTELNPDGVPRTT